jgi:hypothetical protein
LVTASHSKVWDGGRHLKKRIEPLAILRSAPPGAPRESLGARNRFITQSVFSNYYMGAKMAVEKMLDDLIEAGWYVLESDFDARALSNWKKEAFDCVIALLGPDHTYSHYFNDFVRGRAKSSILAGEGVLNAVREHLIKGSAC